MANAERIWETFDEILAHQELWDQNFYCTGNYNPKAQDWHECGTTACIGGFRCLMDGLRPYANENGYRDSYTYVDPDGKLHGAEEYATSRLELTPGEVRGLLYCYSHDTAEFKERIQEVIDGKWRDKPRYLFDEEL